MSKILIILLCGSIIESFIYPSQLDFRPFHTSFSVAIFAQEGSSPSNNDIGRNEPDGKKTGKRYLNWFDRSPASKDNSKTDATAQNAKPIFGIRTRLFNWRKDDAEDSWNTENTKGKSVQGSRVKSPQKSEGETAVGDERRRLKVDGIKGQTEKQNDKNQREKIEKNRSTPSIEDIEDDPSLIQRFKSFSLAKKKPKEEKEQTPKGKGTVGAIQTFFSGLLSERNEEKWVFACPKSRLSPGEIVPVDAAGLDLLIIASQDGRKLHCLANSCSHLGTPLEVGTLERRPVELKDTTSIKLGSEKSLTESDVTALLTDDGCEDCIVCPLHKTAFVLETGEVNGEWCPYPPVLGAMMGKVKGKTPVPIFEVRTKGKNIEVRITSSVLTPTAPKDSNEPQDINKMQ